MAQELKVYPAGTLKCERGHRLNTSTCGFCKQENEEQDRHDASLLAALYRLKDSGELLKLLEE